MFEINLDEIISIIKEHTVRYKKLPQFPEVRRDLAFVINEEVSFDDIQKVIKGAVQQNIFKGSEVFDVYQGENIEKGFKSLAFRIKMQDENATLTDEVIERQMNNVRAKLQKTYAEISFREQERSHSIQHLDGSETFRVNEKRSLAAPPATWKVRETF